MTKLFKAAACSQCGRALDLETLSCLYCGKSYAINWDKAIPTVGGTEPPEGYYPERDQRMDAVLLSILQREAAKQDVKVVLALESRLERSIIDVYVRDKKSGQLEKAGEISCQEQHTDDGGFDYRVSFEGHSATIYSEIYRICWTNALGATGDRLYKVILYYSLDGSGATGIFQPPGLSSGIPYRNYTGSYHSTTRMYYGEDELIEKAGLHWLIEVIIDYASHWETYEREQAERTERAKRTAKRSRWKKFFDWWDDFLDTSRQLP